MKKLCVLLFLLFCKYSFCQKLERDKHYYLAAIGFWNVENLYDTLNDKWKNDEDFTPEGAYAWNGERYRLKIDHLAQTIKEMASDVSPDGLALMGLCEIENKSVVADLVNSPQLKSRNYQIIHIEGPDARGVDPSFIYNPNYFKVKNAVAYQVKLPTDSNHKTRDILVVSGVFLGEPLAVLVNHWPSRRGGELVSRVNRNAAATLARKIADSISSSDAKMKVLIMGDLNDDPVNDCVKKNIRTYSDVGKARDDEYYNPMEKLYKAGIGTLAYQDSWNLFDQILLNKNWFSKDYSNWHYYSVRINNKNKLRTQYGNYKGYPFRTYSGGIYTGGYSDHFASYIIIAKEK
ncbi:MAG: endonuclease/exonuclease/phosphatase family protein [bacterium]|nr:endonuclease/exonuclease/phosphatase family protein [bacterium]